TIFDIKSNKTVWCKYLDSSYKNIVIDVKEKFDYVGIQAITEDDIYHILVEYNCGDDFVRDKNFPYNDICDNQLPDNCCKVLFQIDNEHFEEFTKYMNEQNYDMFNFVKSGGECFEMMAKNISKGYPLEKIAELYGKNIDNVATIGDFYNDIEMIKKAKIGCAVNNAPQEVKNIADIVVASCEEDGLAEFIEYLINKF
ncbi:MAG: HAD hydrolase family protein, partial [Oscillospiraceae bacterium]